MAAVFYLLCALVLFSTGSESRIFKTKVANKQAVQTTTVKGEAGGTTTPVSNEAVVATQPTRKPCSANASVTCNPYGGPGLYKQPNIVVFVSDDMGHADLGYTEGHIHVPTPNIDKLAWDGIIMQRYYTNRVCSPTRASFLTGKYTHRIGMQGAAIAEGEPWGLPLNFKVAPQYFKDLGYDTWATGKWHLGCHKRAFFPSSRGFDESYMIMPGESNWFNYTVGWITPIPIDGRAIRENGKMVFANITNNAYLPELFTNVAEKWIRNANPENPFFLYFATPAVHTAFEPYGEVLHTMAQYQLRPPVFSFTDRYPQRKKYLAIVQVLDEQFKRVVDALTYKGIINNTIVAFFNDNGAAVPLPSFPVHGVNYGSNFPLRLGKGSLFEGGVRTPSFIWSPLLPKRGRITNQLFDVSDWLPTLYEAAGGDVNQLGDHPRDLDGQSQWRSLYNGLNYGPRTELVNNIDTLGGTYAMIYQDSYGVLYKIIGGNVFNNRAENLAWYRPADTTGLNPQTIWTPVAIQCNFPDGVEVNKCIPWVADCLYDLTNDPCESNNIAASYPSMLKLLQNKLAVYNTSSIPAAVVGYDPKSNPQLWDGFWVPWQDDQPWDRVPLTFSPFTPSSSY